MTMRFKSASDLDAAVLEALEADAKWWTIRELRDVLGYSSDYHHTVIGSIGRLEKLQLVETTAQWEVTPFRVKVKETAK